MTWFNHTCHFCGHKSKEVDAIYSDINMKYQCKWKNNAECYERRYIKYPWERKGASIYEGTPLPHEINCECNYCAWHRYYES